MDKFHKSKKAGTYVVMFTIILFALLLIYYALTASTANRLSFGITSWTLTNISKAFYPVNIANISSVFNSSNNQLYLLVKLQNSGSSEIGYLSGCVSSLSGIIYPSGIANLTYEKNVASCNAITIAQMLPNQTATLQWPFSPLPNQTATFQWPFSPQIIKILKAGNFNVTLTFPFGFYNTTKIYCPRANVSCPRINYSFGGFTENATIQVSISAVN
ncbi:hypothetical protein M1137_03430 [Candidatus Parvarchaeota archaeon]|nr:hypothetical protein [Candidatus Parvarchaeota archaeon]